MSAGLDIVRGNLTKYLNLLKLFERGHGDDIATLKEHLQHDRMQDALRLAHSLKGVAGTMGADALRQAAMALEMGIRENLSNDDLLVRIEALGIELEPVIEDIREAARIADSLAPADNAPDAEKVRLTLLHLLALLEKDDSRVNTAWEERAALLGSALGPGLAERLGNQIAQFEYDKAMETLRGILNRQVH